MEDPEHERCDERLQAHESKSFECQFHNLLSASDSFAVSLKGSAKKRGSTAAHFSFIFFPSANTLT
jgi:hypothetical protein